MQDDAHLIKWKYDAQSCDRRALTRDLITLIALPIFFGMAAASLEPIFKGEAFRVELLLLGTFLATAAAVTSPVVSYVPRSLTVTVSLTTRGVLIKRGLFPTLIHYWRIRSYLIDSASGPRMLRLRIMFGRRRAVLLPEGIRPSDVRMTLDGKIRRGPRAS